MGRKSHVALINYAKTYLVNTQQRQAFVDIMHEILEAPDQGGRFRLSNKVARRRAERYLANLDYFF